MLWSGVNGAVFESISPHEGIVILRQEAIYTSNDVVRVRFDLSLADWKEQDNRLNKVVEDTVNVATGVQLPITRSRQGVVQLAELLDTDKWVYLLSRRKQPLLTLMPSERLEDSVSTSSTGYQASKKTYHLASPCNDVPKLLNLQTLRESWILYFDFLKEKGTTTLAPPASGRRKRGADEDAMNLALARISDLIQQVQLAVDAGSKTFNALAEGKFPEDCISSGQWTAIATAVAPRLTTEDRAKYLKDIHSFLNRFPLTMYRLVEENNTHTIRVVVLIPAPGSVSSLILRSLRYIPTKINGKRMTLKQQPLEIMSDLQQRWIAGKSPKEILQERCLPSWESSSQYWCYGGLELEPSQPMKCVLDALPADNRHPEESCYSPLEKEETQIVPLPSGNLLVSPAKQQEITIQCNGKYHKQIVSEDTTVTLPRGCSGVIGKHVFTANPLSSIIEPPADWDDKHSLPKVPPGNELVPHDSFNENGPIVSFPDDDWSIHVPVVPATPSPDLPVWISESKDWIEHTFERQDVQIGVGATLAIIFLYCCCAPASWPRLNGPAWLFGALGRAVAGLWARLGSIYRTMARRQPARRRRRNARGVGGYHGEIFRDPLERAIMLSQL